MECLKYVQRLRKSTNRKLLASPTGTDEGKPDKKKRGRTKKVVQGEVVDVEIDPPSPDESPDMSPFRPLNFYVLRIWLVARRDYSSLFRTSRSAHS